MLYSCTHMATVGIKGLNVWCDTVISVFLVVVICEQQIDDEVDGLGSVSVWSGGMDIKEIG